MEHARWMSNRSTPAPPCPACGGERVWGTIGAATAADLTVTVRAPGGFRTQLSPLVALTCMVCGEARLYATAPQNLHPGAP